ncbi:MAG: helix-turn-helix domain-containing protein [Bacteroidaceae bacterium]
MKIRETIINKRKECGMTQKELSEKTGIQQNRISEFEAGKRDIVTSNVDKIFEVLDEKYLSSRERMWNLAKECATILKNKGFSKISDLSKDTITTLTEKEYLLSLKEISDDLYDELSAKGSEPANTFNYMKALIRFHLSLIS